MHSECTKNALGVHSQYEKRGYSINIENCKGSDETLDLNMSLKGSRPVNYVWAKLYKQNLLYGIAKIEIGVSAGLAPPEPKSPLLSFHRFSSNKH